MAQKFLIPRKGLIVRDPVSYTQLQEKGELKDWNSFWRRRVRDGDCYISEFVSVPEIKEEKLKRGRNK